jgi:lycopene beta-cyclase
MDFDVTQENGITFVYVLPFSETDALVEPTIFSRFPLESEAYTKLIRNYLRERFEVSNYEVRFQEQGIIPMTAELAPPARPGRVISIGTSAGMVKGSTGYGFLAIQKWNRSVVAGIADGRIDRLPDVRSGMSVVLDRIFLSFLEAHPSAAPEVFYGLFQKVSPDRLVRFLSDLATPADTAAVIASMPKIPFIRRAMHVLAAKGG